MTINSNRNPIRTPDGLFNTAREAAEHYGVSITAIKVRVRDINNTGFFYEKLNPNKPSLNSLFEKEKD